MIPSTWYISFQFSVVPFYLILASYPILASLYINFPTIHNCWWHQTKYIKNVVNIECDIPFSSNSAVYILGHFFKVDRRFIFGCVSRDS